MEPIKAFVGHSFTPEDNHVVQTILQCLRRVSSLHPRFTWISATEPEPSVVGEKVLALLEDKNLFIAICTRKERVIADSQLKPSWLFSNSFVGKREDFLWKTSDWIIQEIGLAIGRSMKIILLVEENIRLPGALQGNLERVEFSRTNPEKCFDKLLGMIASLAPIPEPSGAAAQDESLTQKENKVEPNEEYWREWATPKADWTFDDFKSAIWRLTLWGKEEEGRHVTKCFEDSEFWNSEENRATWSANRERILIFFDRGGDLGKIEKIANSFPRNTEVLTDLARSYLKYEEYEKSAKIFEKAALHAKDVDNEIYLLGRAAHSFQKAGSVGKTDEVQRLMREKCARHDAGISRVLDSELEIADLRSDSESAVALLEKILELSPDNIKQRFSLAYKYSQIDRSEMAAYHYSKIGVLVRDSGTWNNLGVAFDKLQLPIKSVQAYSRAHEKGHTLASSNLAHKYLGAGFLREAEALLTDGIKIAGHHVNIDKAMATVANAKESEETKEGEISRKAKPISQFYRELGQALITPLAISIDGQWKSPTSTLDLRVIGAKIIATGEYERRIGGVLANLGIGLGSQAETTSYIEEYSGELRGRAIIGFVTRKQKGEAAKPTTLLSYGADQNTVALMWISDSGDTIYVSERSPKGEPNRIELKRI